jgi:hypothetical protein
VHVAANRYLRPDRGIVAERDIPDHHGAGVNQHPRAYGGPVSAIGADIA